MLVDLGFEDEFEAGREARGDQILHDLRLTVDHDRAAAGQLVHRHVMALAGELEVDAAVDDPFAVEPRCNAELAEEVDGALLEHARANPRLHVLAAAALEHDRLDTRPLEQSCQRQPRRARADDADLRPHRRPSSRAAFSFRISGRTSSLNSACSKSFSQRSGVISGKSEPKRTRSRSCVFA